MLTQLTTFRRELHQIPELDFDLPKTLDYVKKHLQDLPCTVFSPCKSTICAYFNCQKEATVAIRSDMDALPVLEHTNVDFESTHTGNMHACGHDGHMAMVLGFAHHIAEHLGTLHRNVLLVFQPAEETSGGAKLVCESGVFEQYHVDRIFGFHLWPDVEKGTIASRSGALLAAANETTITFLGKSSHIARAEEGRDANLAAAAFLVRIYEHMKTLTEQEPCLLKFGRIEGGEVRNAISPKAQLEGSLRTFSLEMRDKAQNDIRRIAQEVAQIYECQAHVHFNDGYPPVINDETLYAKATDELAQHDIHVEQLE
ncbi:MAG: amidohydrolase, partial [Eggerthellaceae bacterium]|nr:amidohydrolase [Eggerthellaceae bacterium]